MLAWNVTALLGIFWDYTSASLTRVKALPVV